MRQTPQPASSWKLQNVIKAQAIEGWFPNSITLSFLNDLASNHVSHQEFLDSALLHSKSVDKLEVAQRRPILQRLFNRNPYQDSDYEVLRNIPRLKTKAALHEFQGVTSSGEMLRLQSITEVSPLLSTHKTLFGHAYHWAGQTRTVALRSKGVHFAPVNQIPEMLPQIENRLVKAAEATEQDDWMSAREYFSSFLNIYLWAHPFRDGNGRTAFSYLMQLFPFCDLSSLTHKKWYAVSAGALASPQEPTNACWGPLFEEILKKY